MSIYESKNQSISLNWSAYVEIEVQFPILVSLDALQYKTSNQS
jgi:hypothetical protein